MVIFRTIVVACLALALVLVFSHADAGSKPGRGGSKGAKGWEQGTKKGWDDAQPPGADNVKGQQDLDQKAKMKGGDQMDPAPKSKGTAEIKKADEHRKNK